MVFPKLRLVLLVAGAGSLVGGCTSYNIGSEGESAPNGSYSGSTLNSPVTDQNPHAGGDASFPSGDVSTDHPPPEKVDGR
jgi:hypothetical protein